MAPPPPPPPGPPPPPMMAPMGPPPGAGGEVRDLLLSSIRQGTKLKKTVTNDKSGPLIGGKISSGNSSTDSSRQAGGGLSGGVGRMNGGPPQLGGLFAGGMPKLKPVGMSNIGSGSNSSPGREGLSKPPEVRNVNRGPPPQPPPASQKPNFNNINTSNTPDSVSVTSNNGHPVPRPQAPSRPPAGGYGKPNVAPKPPPIGPNTSALHPTSMDPSQQSKPSPPVKKLLMNGGSSVSRAQSMRSPRSPPVAPPAFPNGPLVTPKGSLHLSQEGLNISRTGTLPHNFHQTLKMAPSPPVTGHRGSPRPPGQRPPPPPHRPAPPTTAPPPPPPHRTSPAPPPPRLPTAAPTSAPPAPPARNSSMRNGSTSSLVVELEKRFKFHGMSEFPDPEPFRCVNKQYSSKPLASNSKQQAPPPPQQLTLQLSQKSWNSHTSQC